MITGITKRLIEHYKQRLFWTAIELMGSLNIFGNPVGLIRSIKKGLTEFVEKPAEGFGKGPLDGGIGIAAGTSALVRNTVGGGFNTIDKITGSIGDGFAALTFVGIPNIHKIYMKVIITYINCLLTKKTL